VLGPEGSWFPNLTLVPVRGTFALEWGGSVYRADPQRGLVAIGRGSTPFGSVDGQSFFVVTSFVPNEGTTTIERWDVTGARIAGPWTLPAGWELAEVNSGTSDIPRETTAGLLVESTSTQNEPSGWFGGRTLGLWRPGESDVRELGPFRFVVGVGRGPAEPDDRIAFTRTGCDRQTGCDLEVLDLGTGASFVVSAPSSFGFVGGGGFSPDGSQLAAFVGSNSMGMNPAASLAMVDVGTHAVQSIDRSEVSVGEPYGWATWDPDGSRVVFGSFTGDHALTVGAGEHQASPLDGVPDAYSVSFLPG
jgi:hypothetical protein